MRRSGMTLTPSINSQDLRRGDGDDEASATFTVCMLLLEDLVGQVPGQEEQVVRAAVTHRVGGEDGQMGAGRIQALLDGGPVDDEVQRLAADAAVVEQGRTLGGSAVSGQALVLALEIREQAAQLAFQISHP